MALQYIINTENGSPYAAKIVLENRFVRAVKKGVWIETQQSRLKFSAVRDSGATNIDLSLDGNLYPTVAIPNTIISMVNQFHTQGQPDIVPEEFYKVKEGNHLSWQL